MAKDRSKIPVPQDATTTVGDWRPSSEEEPILNFGEIQDGSDCFHRARNSPIRHRVRVERTASRI